MRAPQIGFAQLVQDFFLLRLVAQRGSSARTVESYRDAFELLFGFIEARTGRPAAGLDLVDLDAPVVLDFLDHLENARGNCVRTRNTRLAAIHSFMRYAALRDPASLPIWRASRFPERDPYKVPPGNGGPELWPKGERSSLLRLRKRQSRW
jgi:integrase/recombinase XerD